MSGCIRGFQKSSWPIRARLTSPQGKAIDIKVNSSGEFSFKNIPAGNYVLLLMRRDTILAMQPIKLPIEFAPLVVDLTPAPEGLQIEF
jgi:hypothetical protein